MLRVTLCLVYCITSLYRHLRSSVEKKLYQLLISGWVSKFQVNRNKVYNFSGLSAPIFWPGPVHLSLSKLGVPCFLEVTILMQNLCRNPISIVHYSLELLDSNESESPVSVTPVVGTTGLYHHIWSCINNYKYQLRIYLRSFQSKDIKTVKQFL